MARFGVFAILICLLTQLTNCSLPAVYGPATLGRDGFYMAATPKDTTRSGNYVSAGVNWGSGFNYHGNDSVDQNDHIYLAFHRSRTHRFIGYSYGINSFYGWYQLKDTNGFRPLEEFIGSYNYYGGNVRGKVFFQSSDKNQWVIRGNLFLNVSFYDGDYADLQAELESRSFSQEVVLVSERTTLTSYGWGPELFFNSRKDFGVGLGLNFVRYINNDLNRLSEPNEEGEYTDNQKAKLEGNYSFRFRSWMLLYQQNGQWNLNGQDGKTISLIKRF